MSKMATMVAVLKILKRHLLPNGKSDWAETWWEALGRHGDAELLNSFHSDICDGCQGRLDSSNNISSQTLMWIEPKLDWQHRSSIEIQNCWKLFWAILKIFKPHLLPNVKSYWAKTWWEAFGQNGDSELLKIFCYDIHDGFCSSQFEDLLLSAHLELMSWSVDHGPSLILLVSNFSHFRHLHQNCIHDGSHGGHLESLHLLSVSWMELKFCGRHPRSMEI